MKYAWQVLLLLALGAWSTLAIAADPASPAEAQPTAAQRVEALASAVGLNVGYAEQSATEKDFKTVGKLTGGIRILIAALRWQSADPAWQTACEGWNQQLSRVDAAARSQQMPVCIEGLRALRSGVEEAAVKFPQDARRPAESRETAGLRPLMDLLQGTYSDGKGFLTSGNLKEARTQGQVLAELGEFLSNVRADAAWAQHSRAFLEAAKKVAVSRETDKTAVLQEFRGVYQSCEACHNRQR